jgi:hypothetical protein
MTGTSGISEETIMKTVEDVTPLEPDRGTVLNDALRRIAEADALTAVLLRNGPLSGPPEWVKLADGREVTARDADQHRTYLLRTAEMLTAVAAALPAIEV